MSYLIDKNNYAFVAPDEVQITISDVLTLDAR